MVWRVLGVAVVLLGVGVVGGYAVADRSQEQPAVAGEPKPLVAVSPAAPTPPAVAVTQDPTDPALPEELPLKTETLRTSKRNGYALDVDVPADWIRNRTPGYSTWNFTPTSTLNTYVLRVGIVYGQHQAVGVLRDARVLALADAARKGDLQEYQLLDQTADSITASYVTDGHLRITNERWVAFDGGSAYAVAAVTGRTVDQAGIPDLLDRVTASMREG